MAVAAETVTGKGATVQDPLEAPEVETPDAGKGRAWRAVRATVLVATLGVAGVLMVEPPRAFHLGVGNVAAALPHVPAGERWITLGSENLSSAPAATTSAAIRASQTRANDRTRHSHKSVGDRSRHTQSAA